MSSVPPARRAAVVITAAALFAACSSSQDDSSDAYGPPLADGSIIAEFDTSAGRFRTVISDPESVERVLNGEIGTHVGIPNGKLIAGDGGVNGPHGWHLIDVEVVDMTIEICDATVDYINDLVLAGFSEEHGAQFCPWSAVLVDVTTS